MKTERRHELATNDLADWIGYRIEELKPYATAIWATVLGVLVLIVAGIYWSRQSEAKLERGWDRFFHARTQTDPDDLREVADDLSKSPPGLWSRMALGDRQLAKGVDLLFDDRAAAEEALKDAADAFQYTIDNAPPGSLLAERATFGLGETFESQNELEKARKQYEALQSKWPGGAFSVQAQRRLADLDKASTKTFYDWFARQEPKPKPAPKTGAPGAEADFDFSKLEEHPFQPQIDLDPTTFGGKKKTGSLEDAGETDKTGKAEDAETTDAPKTEATKAEEKPASDAEEDSAGKSPEEE